MLLRKVFNIKHLFCIPNFVLVIFGILFGTASALVWNGGYIQFVRPTLPYVLVFAILLFVVTAVLKAKCGNTEEKCLSSTCFSLRKYSPLIMITSAIFIVFSIVVLATYLPYTFRLILAFIGSISFWTMLFEFMAMVACIVYRR